MVEVARGRFQSVGYVTHGIAAGKLAEYHAHKLAPYIIALTMFVCPGLFDQMSYLFLREKRDYLRE